MLDTSYDALHYEVTLHVNVDEPVNGALVFHGSVNIDIQLREDGLEALVLNVKALKVTECTYRQEGAEDAVATTGMEEDKAKERITLRFGQGVLDKNKKGVLHLEFEGNHR